MSKQKRGCAHENGVLTRLHHQPRDDLVSGSMRFIYIYI